MEDGAKVRLAGAAADVTWTPGSSPSTVPPEADSRARSEGGTGCGKGTSEGVPGDEDVGTGGEGAAAAVTVGATSARAAGECAGASSTSDEARRAIGEPSAGPVPAVSAVSAVPAVSAEARPSPRAEAGSPKPVDSPRPSPASGPVPYSIPKLKLSLKTQSPRPMQTRGSGKRALEESPRESGAAGAAGAASNGSVPARGEGAGVDSSGSGLKLVLKAPSGPVEGAGSPRAAAVRTKSPRASRVADGQGPDTEGSSSDESVEGGGGGRGGGSAGIPAWLTSGGPSKKAKRPAISLSLSSPKPPAKVRESFCSGEGFGGIRVGFGAGV